MKKAILEIPVPESCWACELSWREAPSASLICPLIEFVGDYTKSRHPDCPLKIVGGKTCQRCGTITAVRIYGICHECYKHIKNYDCKKEANHG